MINKRLRPCVSTTLNATGHNVLYKAHLPKSIHLSLEYIVHVVLSSRSSPHNHTIKETTRPSHVTGSKGHSIETLLHFQVMYLESYVF